MADRYLRPGESALAPADGTPVSGEGLEKQADEFFDVDQELSAGLMESTERDMRRQLKFKGGMLLQDDDGSVFDAGAIFEDSKGETHSLEVGDPLPGYEGYLVSEIRPGRRGGVEVEFLGRRGEPVIFGTGPTSGGRGFGEARAKREAMVLAEEMGMALTGMPGGSGAGAVAGAVKAAMAARAARAAGMSDTFVTPEEQYDYEEEAVFDNDGAARVDEIADGGGRSGMKWTDEKRNWAHGVRASHGEGAEVVSETKDGGLVVETEDGDRYTVDRFVPASYMDALSVLENDASRLFRELSEIENGEL